MGLAGGTGCRKLTRAAGKSPFLRKEPADPYTENSSGPHSVQGRWHRAQCEDFRTVVVSHEQWDRSAVTAGTVSVGSASARSQEPLGRHARSARPARMLAAPRGNGPAHSPSLSPQRAGPMLSRPASHSPPPASSTHPALLGSKTLTNINQNSIFETPVPWGFHKTIKRKQNEKKRLLF